MSKTPVRWLIAVIVVAAFGTMLWLATRQDAIEVPESARVLEALPRFQEEKAKLQLRWGKEIPWADLILAARKVVPHLD